MRLLVTGGTGFIGRALCAECPEVTVLTRNPAAAAQSLPGARIIPWDPLRPPPTEAWDGVEGVVHLAGESIAEGRWTAAKKQRLRTSRVDATAQLVAGMLAAPKPPRVLVAASAIGFYGARDDEQLDERSPPGDDFLARLCQDWEAASAPAADAGVRVVHLRIGIVLEKNGGALGKMLLPFRLGLGGRMGNGQQWMSWIHRADLLGLIRHALADDRVRGPLNAVAPQPVRNIEFTQTLARVLHRPAFFPMPGIALRVVLGEFGQFLLDSQRVLPRAAMQGGYQFEYSELATALQAILTLPRLTAA